MLVNEYRLKIQFNKVRKVRNISPRGERALKCYFSVFRMSQNEHFTGISVYFMDIMGDFLQVCFSDLYSSVSKWWLRDNISGNFAKFSPN
jgi:hypothetical protein